MNYCRRIFEIILNIISIEKMYYEEILKNIKKRMQFLFTAFLTTKSKEK